MTPCAAAGNPVAAPKTLLQFLERHRRGQFAGELSIRWRELLDAVHTYRAAGQLTVTIKVKPTKNPRQLDIHPEISLKLPRPEAITGTYYVAETDEGLDLSVLDPDQDPLPGFAEPAAPPPVPMQLIRRTPDPAQEAAQ